MSGWKFLSGLVSPLTNLIDELHTSEDERLQVKASIFEMQTQLADKVMEYETKLMQAQAQVITAEAQGASWLQT